MDLKSKTSFPSDPSSIQYAPSNKSSPELALGYANRSAVLYHMGKYEACLNDINRALDNGYPQNLIYKLLYRKAQCHCALNRKLEAQTAIEATKEAIASLGPSELTCKRKDTIVNDLLLLNKKVDKISDLCSAAPPVSEWLPLSHGPNPVILQASAAVGWKYNEKQGRYLVANQSIAAGDTLIVEKPYAAVLLPDQYDTHCHHCFTKLLGSVPCQQCVEVQYCSEECRDASWDSYHCIECPYLEIMHSIGIGHLSFRVVLVSGLQKLLAFRRSRSRICSPSEAGLSENGSYGTDYETVYHLMTHSEHMQPEDLFHYALTATLLLKCLKKSNFFMKDGQSKNLYKNQTNHENVESLSTLTLEKSMNDCSAYSAKNEADGRPAQDLSNTRQATEITSDDEVYIGGLLLRHVLQLICNAHAITELQTSSLSTESLVDSLSQVRIATAIYPTASLMNHSCDPTIISSFQNDILIVKATKDVEKGEEIFNCYGPNCRRMPWAERQKCLKEQYFFECTCTACTKDVAKEEKFKALKCPSCAGPLTFSKPTHLFSCVQCGQQTHATEQLQGAVLARELFVQGIVQLEQGNYSEALPKLKDCYKLRSEVLYKYNQDLSEVCDQLARCHASQGKFLEASKYLTRSVESTEVLYGVNSIELANELQKYAEVLYNAKKFKEALNVTDRALSIFKLHYDLAHTSVKEMMELKFHLQYELGK
ncbi:SET and MYND domain-containing protein 4 [Lingula anatina]|uniref:Protein-lysine N-methyltransferase SMYD4 n=1 Tax=Lingula anatina TaxID=7574 RepID=A0A2R2MMS8_LINAN|nr:SET and MYND domain-containing protein 4 [Lingula anatina]|eukprot:XP_023931505.1 SET and MYND domain-containing protein 4 [Lingula anatina]